jgi:hypothetical protein
MLPPIRSPRTTVASALALALGLFSTGCVHPKITAVSLDPATFGRKTGIPFYLPKPLLIVAKNFRNIEETRVGLTESAPIPNAFDDQAKFAGLNARTNLAGLGPTLPAQRQAGEVYDPAEARKAAPWSTPQGGHP